MKISYKKQHRRDTMKLIATWVTLLALFCPPSLLFASTENDSTHKIHLAVAGPMEDVSSAGTTFFNAANLFAEHFNDDPAHKGFEVVIHPFDDQNNLEQAQKVAKEISDHQEIIGVIGHNYSNISIGASRVYKEGGISAISPTSTNDNVVKDNKWMFTNIFNDSFQGRFLAHYAKFILSKEKAFILYEDQKYGKLLAETFEKESQTQGTAILAKREYSTSEFESSIEGLAGEMKEVDQGSIIFIAGHIEEVAKLVHYLKTHDIDASIIVPDAVAQKDFHKAFQAYPKELQSPGYYANGIYAATPLLYPSAGEEAQQFASKYQDKVGLQPDWRAAYAYDATMMLTQAVMLSKSYGPSSEAEESLSLKQRRANVQQMLANFNTSNQSIQGLSGLNFFEPEGNMKKPLTVARFRHNKLLPAPIQIRQVSNPKEIIGLSERIQEGSIFEVDDKFYYRTFVVYSGVDLKKIGKLDLNQKTRELEFDLWFRYQEGIAVNDIEFCNAYKPIKLRMPVEELTYGQSVYQRYQVKGVFKTDFVERRSPDHHSLGICFSNSKHNNTNILYIPDVVGGDVTSFGDNIPHYDEFKAATGWTPEEFTSYQSQLNRPIQGNIKYIHNISKTITFSSFFTVLTLTQSSSVFRNLISYNWALQLFVLSIILFLLFEEKAVFKLWWPFVGKRFFLRRSTKVIQVSAKPSTGFLYNHDYGTKDVVVEVASSETPVVWPWYIKHLAIVGFIYAFEIIFIDFLFHRAGFDTINQFRLYFDILWWFVPAIILIRGVYKFGWLAIEQSTGQKIPIFVQILFALTILSLAMLGVMTFVFQQTAAGIIGTSGIFLMILGLAVQMNITNIFAGLVLSSENTIKKGDWVKIDNLEEGKVISVNWRAIVLRQRDSSVQVIPNGIISDSNFRSYSTGEPVEYWEFIHFPKEMPYEEAEGFLMTAMLATDEVLKDPGPSVALRQYTHWSAKYVYCFNLADYGLKKKARKKIHRRLMDDLQAAGVETANLHHDLDV